MSAAAAKNEGIALLAGLGTAYLVAQHFKPDAEAAECAKLFPGASQSLLQAMAGVAAHPVEDAALGFLSIFDLVVNWETAAAVDPKFSAQFYGWFNSLTPEQTAALKAAEGKAVLCAAKQTGSQLSEGASYALSALAGFVVFRVVRDLEAE